MSRAGPEEEATKIKSKHHKINLLMIVVDLRWPIDVNDAILQLFIAESCGIHICAVNGMSHFDLEN